MIGFFGDSWIDTEGDTTHSWPCVVAKLLNERAGYHGKSGTSHWYAYQTFLKHYKKYDTKLRQRKFNLKLKNPENKELKDKISEQKKLNKQKLLENPEIKEKYRLKNIRDAKKYRDNEKLIYNNLLEKEKKENAFNTIKYAILSKIARNKFLLLKNTL